VTTSSSANYDVKGCQKNKSSRSWQVNLCQQIQVSGDPDAPTQNLLGLGALAAELAAEGISVRDLFARTGVEASQLEDAHARISHRQRRAVYRNAKKLAKRSDIGLLAGARQRISDYGIYGYAMDPARFAEVDRMTRDTGTYLIPAIDRLSGLAAYFAGASPTGSTGHVSLWESDAHAQQLDSLKEMIVNARRDAEAVGVGFTPIVDYPAAWHI
jgi:hypothetical protein